MENKSIPLSSKHIALGAKMVPFAGYSMPLRYTSDIEEHMTVRQSVGIFDVSHMGEFLVEGPNAADFLQWTTANNIHKLYDGRAQYSYLPNETGGIVDDLLVYRINAQKYLLVVNASNIEKDFVWLNTQNLKFGARLRNLSDEICLFAVQGPKAADALQPLASCNLANIPYYHFETATFAGIPDVVISATGYTGSGGFELYVPVSAAESIWDAILRSGAPFHIKPIGLGARDTLRLEMGYLLYGNDIDETTSPTSAGLAWVADFNKNFVGKKAIEESVQIRQQKKLVGFVMSDKGIPRARYSITDAHGNDIGTVTSGTLSPVLQKGIGLGYIDPAFSDIGTEIYLKIREQLQKAIVYKPPFIPKT